MNKRAVINVVSALVVVIGLMILLSGVVGWLMNDMQDTIYQMFISAAFSITFGSIDFIFLLFSPLNILTK